MNKMFFKGSLWICNRLYPYEEHRNIDISNCIFRCLTRSNAWLLHRLDMSARFISKMNSACQTNSQNWEDEMFLKVSEMLTRLFIHNRLRMYIFTILPLRTKTNLMALLCKHFSALPKSFCTCVSVLNYNYEPPFLGTDVLNWFRNITVSANSCWYKNTFVWL